MNCDLIFLDSAHHLLPNEERARYAGHENDIHDQAYRNFVRPLVDKILEYTNPDMRGMDYGCGPGPVIAQMLREKKYKIELYDIYFANDESLLNKKYDFIFANEVVEHFKAPAKEFELIIKMLNSDANLFLGTHLHPRDKNEFSNWYYRRDPTHVTFYSEETMHWLAAKYSLSIKITQPRMTHLFRPSSKY